jgi:Phage stabilisation protein
VAFTNSPQNQTYKTVNLPFNGVEMFRSGDLTNTRDLQIVNAYYDRVTQENTKRTVALKKRPGLGATAYSMSKSASTDPVRGSWYDAEQNAMYWAVNNHVYKVKPDVSATPVLVTTLGTSSGYVGFCNYLYGNGTRLVCFSDGIDLWLENYVAVTCNKVVDPDMPTPHQPYPIYLDGYIFLVKANTSDLYNSDVNDPTSWDANGIISCEINSDLSLRPIKVKNYLCVLGYRSIEYFYDAINSAPSSPLSRNDSPYRGVGYVTGGCAIGDTTFFVGQDNNQNLSVYTINSFKVDQVSNAVVDSTLQAFSAADDAKGQVTLNKDGFSISVDGHDFYVLPTPQTTWVYDIDEKFWYEWKNSDGVGVIIEAAWSMYNGSQYVAIRGQANISVLSPSLYQDFGLNYTVRYTTDNFTADSFNWKNCYRLMLVCDMYNYVGTSNMTVTWSDNDWGDGGEGITRRVNLFSSSPFIKGLGRFRNRSWRFEYADNYPLRMTMAMLELNVGTN